MSFSFFAYVLHSSLFLKTTEPIFLYCLKTLSHVVIQKPLTSMVLKKSTKPSNRPGVLNSIFFELITLELIKITGVSIAKHGSAA